MNYLSYDTVKYFFKGVREYSKENLLRSGKGHKLKNLCVSRAIWGLSVWGSINKFQNGNNVETFHPFDSNLVTQQICNELNIIPYTTIISRLDIAVTIEMEKPIEDYLSLLISTNRMKKKIYPNETITFCNKTRAFNFYDKVKQMQKYDPDIAHDYLGKNLLRIELQLKKLREWKHHSIYDSDLSNEQFYNELVHYFQTHYTNVLKYAVDPKDSIKSKNKDDFIAGLVLQYLISQGNPFGVLKYDKNRSYAYNKHRAIIKDIFDKHTSPERKILLEELDTKVHEVCTNSLTLFQ